VAVANPSAGTASVLVNAGDWPPPNQTSISLGDVRKQEGHQGTTLFVFTVSLSAAYDQPVTVHYATADGTATAADGDYVSQSGTLTFAPGETAKTITIVVKGDKKVESDETFFVDLSDASNAFIEDGQGLGTILNDDKGGGTKGR
jgi:Calx-beta domain